MKSKYSQRDVLTINLGQKKNVISVENLVLLIQLIMIKVSKLIGANVLNVEYVPVSVQQKYLKSENLQMQ